MMKLCHTASTFKIWEERIETAVVWVHLNLISQLSLAQDGRHCAGSFHESCQKAASSVNIKDSFLQFLVDAQTNRSMIVSVLLLLHEKLKTSTLRKRRSCDIFTFWCWMCSSLPGMRHLSVFDSYLRNTRNKCSDVSHTEPFRKVETGQSNYWLSPLFFKQSWNYSRQMGVRACECTSWRVLVERH